MEQEIKKHLYNDLSEELLWFLLLWWDNCGSIPDSFSFFQYSCLKLMKGLKCMIWIAQWHNKQRTCEQTWKALVH